jgi:hypothetical protein
MLIKLILYQIIVYIFIMGSFVTQKIYGVMVKNLNLQSGGEGFKSSHQQLR